MCSSVRQGDQFGVLENVGIIDMNRILLKGVAAVAVTGMLSGCGFFTNLDNSLNTSIEKQETRMATFVSDKCIAKPAKPATGKGPAPFIETAIAGAVLTSVVGNVIDLGVEKIREFNEEKTTRYIARGVGELGDGKCITILRAQLSTNSDLSKDDVKDFKLDLETLKKIKVSAVPEFAVELKMKDVSKSVQGKKATSILGPIKSPVEVETTAVTVQLTADDGQQRTVSGQRTVSTQRTVSIKKIGVETNYVLFRKSAAKTYPYNEKEVGIVLVLRSSPTDKDTQDDVVKGAEFVLPLDFGKLKPGQYYNDPALFPEAAMVLDMKHIETKNTKIKITDSADGSTIAEDEYEDDTEYQKKFNAYALVVEAEDKSKVLEVIASALEDSKETILGEIKDKN
ncbi:MAG: hypothetical protein CMO07_00335 [Thalassospira sp.]|nr:hypothetical protein [Thalassospira sp.]